LAGRSRAVRNIVGGPAHRRPGDRQTLARRRRPRRGPTPGRNLRRLAAPLRGLAVQRDGDVAVLATAGEDLQRLRQLVVNLERVAVGVVEIHALLADVIDRARDLDAVLAERSVRVLERGLGLDAEGDVT